jgi:hypothetical protein
MDLRFDRVVDFGVLGGLWRGESSPLRQLCRGRVKPNDQNIMLASYIILTDRIRNRDAHAYVPNVRDDHYWLVPKLFVKSFRILSNLLPGGSIALSQWRKDAKEFVTTF